VDWQLTNGIGACHSQVIYSRGATSCADPLPGILLLQFPCNSRPVLRMSKLQYQYIAFEMYPSCKDSVGKEVTITVW